MICTFCKRVFHKDDGGVSHHDVSKFFNTRKGTVDTCSERCYNRVKIEHHDWLTWYVNYT